MVAESKDFHLKPITIERAAKHKFYWTKFKEFCASLNRAPEHFSAFLSAELGIMVLLAEEKLVMEGRRIEQKKIEDITKKYISRR